MLTPAFELNQDHKFVYVYIKTPYIKISDVEYFIEGYQFKFYVKPYFLRLNLPEKLVENGEESASYDVDKGIFTVKLPKLVPGSHFQDLDLLTKLLAPPGKSNISAPLIEVVSEEPDGNIVNEDEENFDWDWHQDVYDEEEEHQLGLNGVKYGFGNQKSGVFYRLKDELKEIVENPSPDELSYSERHLARVAAEDMKFDSEYYLADYFESERIQEVLLYVVDTKNEVSLTDEEKTKLRQLPNKEYLLDGKEEKSVFFSLVDILFAFAYNKRTTLGENTVESTWTISKLSSTLSWFERFTSLEDVLVACCRRSLAYPLYRHWDLSCKVIQDVKDIFRAGRRKILQCLLEIHTLFNASEPRYIFNELYVTDYCVWIQKVKERKVESLAKKLSQTTVTKDDLGLELRELETAASLVYEEQTNDSSQSSNEPSSSEDSETDTGEDSSSDESTDGESVEEVDNTQKDGFSEVSIARTQSPISGGDVFGGNSSSFRDDRDSSVPGAVQETVSEDEKLDGVEVLPSLLFRNESGRTKPLIEVLSDEQDEVDTKSYCEKSVSGSASQDDVERLHGNGGAMSIDKKETDAHQIEITDDRDLSRRILDLSLTDKQE